MDGLNLQTEVAREARKDLYAAQWHCTLRKPWIARVSLSQNNTYLRYPLVPIPGKGLKSLSLLEPGRHGVVSLIADQNELSSLNDVDQLPNLLQVVEYIHF